jgi:hypothetical protein
MLAHGKEKHKLLPFAEHKGQPVMQSVSVVIPAHWLVCLMYVGWDDEVAEDTTYHCSCLAF